MNRRASQLLRSVSIAALVIGAGLPSADAQTDSPAKATDQQRAQELFDLAYQLAQKGDYEGAARKFQEAYSLSPNANVLFNLGQAYAAAGEPVAAYSAFERYLAERDPQQKDAQRERLVRQLMVLAEQRIGELALDIEPADSSIEVDGQQKGRAPLAHPLRLKTGPHAIVVRHPEYQTLALNVSVSAGRETREVARLERSKQALEPGYLLLRCSVPDLEITVAEREIGKTPWALPILLRPGEHVIELRRSGYLAQSSSVSIPSGGGSWLDCDGRYAKLEPRDAARLSLPAGLAGAEGARLYVDGRPWPDRARLLPSGQHLVEVRAHHFEAWQAQLSLAPGENRELHPDLIPTEDYRRENALRRDQHVFWSGIALGAGITFSVTALALGVLNAGKKSHWEDEKEALQGELPNTSEATARLRSNYEEALEIQRLEYATFATGVLGAVSFGISGVLWFTAPEVPVVSEVRLGASPRRLALIYGGQF